MIKKGKLLCNPRVTLCNGHLKATWVDHGLIALRSFLNKRFDFHWFKKNTRKSPRIAEWRQYDANVWTSKLNTNNSLRVLMAKDLGLFKRVHNKLFFRSCFAFLQILKLNHHLSNSTNAKQSHATFKSVFRWFLFLKNSKKFPFISLSLLKSLRYIVVEKEIPNLISNT